MGSMTMRARVRGERARGARGGTTRGANAGDGLAVMQLMRMGVQA